MDAVTEIRKIATKECFVSGMTGIVTDIKQIALKEMPIYVVIASCLSLVVLLLAMDSLVVPVLFLLCIGVAVLYNLGSNIFLGQISYITQALTAVLQLGVTMDYSIFLLNSYEENKKRFEGDKERAMAHAINATFKSVIGSSITTVAGFIALCFMTFALGRDMGIVMAKGVVIGVLCCVTLLPALVLTFDGAIEKTTHRKLIPSDLKKMLESDEYEMEFICSEYKTATDEVNNQIDEIQKIVKGYSPESMVIGEAPLTKDLQDVTDVDLKTVNTISILAIFIIIMVVFKSISLPFILVAVIEFAIFVNMSVPFYQGKEVVFVASIVIGCIQLGATVDYAILMTSRYQKERGLGKSKKEAVSIAHKTSMKSIIISGCSFFAATFGVGLYTQVDMIGSITNLLSRGAVISTLVVLLVLPAMFMIFDPLICRTSIGFAKKKGADEKKLQK